MGSDTEDATPEKQRDTDDRFRDIKKIHVTDLSVGDKHLKVYWGDAGENGNVTFKATVKNKKYFLRDRPARSATILSSKIARIISKKHFASEKWVSDGRTVSESVPESAIPNPEATCDALLSKQRSGESVSQDELEKYKKIVKKQKNRIRNSHIKGLGIIDEVCAFIGEEDRNIENLMFSDENFDDNSYAIKIDFNLCFFCDSPYSVQYTDDRVIFGNSYSLDYRIERAKTRLKLSLISDAMIDALLETYCPEPERAKNKTLLIKNRDKACDLLKSEMYGLPVLFDNKENIGQLIQDLTGELCCYSQKHFPQKSNSIKTNLNLRAIELNCLNELKIFLGIIIKNNYDYKIEAVKKHSGLKELKNKPALSLKDFFNVCDTKKWSNNFFGYCWRDSEIEKLYGLGRKCQSDSSEINYKELSTYLKILNDKMSRPQVLDHYFSLK